MWPEPDRVNWSVQMQPWDWSRPSSHPLWSLNSYPSGKQWAAVRTQQEEIRLPPQRNTFSLDLLRQNMAATQGWDSTVATVPPTIFICFLLVRCPHVKSVSSADEMLIFIHLREWSVKMTSSVRYWLPVAGSVVVGGARLDTARWDSIRNTWNTNYSSVCLF